MHAVFTWLGTGVFAVLAVGRTHAAPTASVPTELNRAAPVRQLMRPANDHLSTRFTQELAAANARALADVDRLRGERARGLPPRNCERADRRAVQVGVGGPFRLRPGQHVVIQGCFGGVLAGSVRLNGSFPGGYLNLPVDEWTDTYVRARVPANLSGVFDGPVRLQLRFGDGGFSNELDGQFLARRAAYELEPVQFPQFLEVFEKSPHPVCGWSAPCPKVEPAYGLLGAGGVMTYTPQPAMGSHGFKGRNPGHQVVGYFVQMTLGTSKFSHWGAAGELMVDWATEPVQGWTWGHLNIMFITKFVVDAPVGTMPGAKARGPLEFVVPSGLVR